jgi:hypothetical protein
MNRCIQLWNRIENPEIELHKYHMLFGKDANTIPERELVFPTIHFRMIALS